MNNYEFIVMSEIEKNRNEGIEDNRWIQLLEKLKRLKKMTDKLIETLHNKIEIRGHGAMNTLSKIGFIFLPLTLITGYFGMNFTSMGMVGHNQNKKGILMTRHGHHYVRFMLIFVLLVALMLLSKIEGKNVYEFWKSVQDLSL